MRAARRTLSPVPQLTDINSQLGKGSAERVAMHPQFSRGTALVAFILLQHGQDEALFELAHRLGVQNVALVHLHYERFQLIFHGISLFPVNAASQSSGASPAQMQPRAAFLYRWSIAA